jgi:predicted ATP-grasp superfamily ATP-dependent carboligase
MRPAIIISGHTPALAVIRGLGCAGVPVVVLSYYKGDMGHVSRYVREVVRIPPLDAEDRVLEALAHQARRRPGALVIAASDPAIPFVARHRHDLEGMGLVVASASEKAALTFLNKSATHALAADHGIPVPRTVTVAAVDDLGRYADAAAFPAVLKPSLGYRYQRAFGRKWTRVDNLDHAVREYRRAAEAGFEVSIQELIGGDELCGANYNSYVVDGVARVELTARKIRNAPPEWGSPSVVVSEDVPEVVDAGRRILQAAEFEGFSCIEFKRDPRDGTYKLIEVNGRHNLSGMLALRCGVNFPWLQYRHLVHGELPEQPPHARGVYWVDVTRDLRHLADYLGRPDYSVRRFLRPYLSSHVFAVASPSDPLPAAVRALHTLGGLRARVRRSVGSPRGIGDASEGQ